MRVLLVSAEYPPETAYGGIGTQALAKARRLTEAGHQVDVISHSTDDAIHQSIRFLLFNRIGHWTALTQSSRVSGTDGSKITSTTENREFRRPSELSKWHRTSAMAGRQ